MKGPPDLICKTFNSRCGRSSGKATRVTRVQQPVFVLFGHRALHQEAACLENKAQIFLG